MFIVLITIIIINIAEHIHSSWCLLISTCLLAAAAVSSNLLRSIIRLPTTCASWLRWWRWWWWWSGSGFARKRRGGEGDEPMRMPIKIIFTIIRVFISLTFTSITRPSPPGADSLPPSQFLPSLTSSVASNSVSVASNLGSFSTFMVIWLPHYSGWLWYKSEFNWFREYQFIFFLLLTFLPCCFHRLRWPMKLIY